MIYSFQISPGVLVAYGDAGSSVIRPEKYASTEFINRQFSRIYSELQRQIGAHAFLQPHQVHGVTSYIATNENVMNLPQPFNFEADISIITANGIAPISLTADCVSIVIASLDGTIAALAHGGWRGLAARIITKTVEQIRSIGGERVELIGWYGPHIRACCYEVSNDVASQFSADCSVQKSEAHWMLDLGAVVREQFHQNAVALFPHAASLQCVSCSLEFCSYRRSKGGLDRNITAVCLNKKLTISPRPANTFFIYR